MGEGVRASVEAVNVALVPHQDRVWSSGCLWCHQPISTSQLGMESWAQAELCSENCGRSSRGIMS